MSGIDKQKYSADAHIAEIYDQIEVQTDDVDLLKRLLGSGQGLNIFEPLCGTGRIALPLARDGHRVTVVDESEAMLAGLRQKLKKELRAVADRVQVVQANVFAVDWPTDQDVVLLGGNCFYEMSSSDEQRALLHRAASALRPGGHVYVDNDDHQSLELLPEWQNPPGERRRAFPSGICADGTRLDGSTETAWYDVVGRFVHYVRRLKVTHPGGETSHHEWRETCHPVLMAETLSWAREAGFVIEQTFGDRKGNSYGPESPRAIVWARRE